jgi:hypothetical protein
MLIKFKQNKRENSISILSIFIVAIVIFYNNETFPSIYFNGPFESIFYVWTILAVFLIYSILFKGKKVNVKLSIVLLILITLILITMLLNQDFSFGFAKIILGLLIGYMMAHLITIKEFTASYVRVILILSIYSLLVMYLIRPLIFSMSIPIFPLFYNSAGLPFIDTKFAVVLYDPNFYRNFGIFREPGVFQIFLNFALVFELFFKKSKINMFTIMILCLTIISTFSTPGYVSAALIISSYILFSGNNFSAINLGKEKKILISFVFTLILMCFLFYSSSEHFRYLVTYTMEKLTNQESSYQGRTVAIISNLTIWLNNPLFGNGIVSGMHQTLELMQNNSRFSVSHNTSTIGALLVVFGSVFTTIFIVYLYKLLSLIKYGKITISFIFIAIMLSINTQLLIYNELLYTIFVFGVLGENLNKNNNI